MNASCISYPARFSVGCNGRRALSWAALFACFHAAAAAQEPPAATLTIVDEAGHSHEFTSESFAELPRHSATVREHDGAEHVWEGPHLGDVLTAAGVQLGDALRGDRAALYLLAEAADGYRVVYALPEVDPTNSEAVVLLADRQDGAAPGERYGPFRIVIPHEKRRARWIRQLVRLTVLAAPPAGGAPSPGE